MADDTDELLDIGDESSLFERPNLRSQLDLEGDPNKATLQDRLNHSNSLFSKSKTIFRKTNTVGSKRNVVQPMKQERE